MIKMTQPKWIVIAVCLCFGARASFGQLENADTYDQRIREENLAVAKLGKQIDENRDGSVVGNNGDLTHADAVAGQKQFLGASWNTQNQINQLLPQIQRTRDDTLKYAASHPGDKKAQANAQEALKVYTNVVKMGNDNGDRIYHATENLHVQDPGTKYPDPPNKIEPAKFAVQKDTKGDTSTQTNPDKPRPSDLDDLKDSQHSKDNIDKLIALAQGYKDANDQKAKDNPDDPWAAGAAADAQHALDELQARRDRINNRITNDLNKLHPPEDKKTGDDAQDHATGPTGTGEDIINDLLGPFSLGGVVMASDQGATNTQKFMNGVDVGGGDTSNQLKDIARDNAKDAARDAARDAASAMRDSAKPGADGMRNCPPGH